LIEISEAIWLKGPQMKIRIKGFLSMREAMGGMGELQMDLEHATIRSALTELSNRCGDELRDLLFDPLSRDVRPYNQILLNGRHYRHLKDGLDAELVEGDMLTIFPPVLGG